MDKLIGKFFELPLWAKLLAAFVIISMLDGARLAWGEHRFIAGFAEATIASMLYNGSVFGTVGLMLYSGIIAANKTKSTALGWVVAWVVGFIVFMIFNVTSDILSQEIPGIGWRYELMMQHD